MVQEKKESILYRSMIINIFQGAAKPWLSNKSLDTPALAYTQLFYFLYLTTCNLSPSPPLLYFFSLLCVLFLRVDILLLLRATPLIAPSSLPERQLTDGFFFLFQKIPALFFSFFKWVGPHSISLSTRKRQKLKKEKKRKRRKNIKKYIYTQTPASMCVQQDSLAA